MEFFFLKFLNNFYLLVPPQKHRNLFESFFLLIAFIKALLFTTGPLEILIKIFFFI